jgi:hypothetical protein
MLIQEPNKTYLVYPSWAEGGYAYSWSQLKAVLLGAEKEDAHVEADPNAKPSQRGHELRFIDGAGGGGVIVQAPYGAWKGRGIMRQAGANFPDAAEMSPVRHLFTSHVSYIEPYTGIGGLIVGGKRARSYAGRMSAEHADAAREDRYWVFDFIEARSSIKAIDRIESLATGFGLVTKRLQEVPEAMRVETQDWFRGYSGQVIWYRVEGGENGAGFQFAMLMYIALNLAKAIRGRQWAHLVAAIEGKPNARKLYVEAGTA